MTRLGREVEIDRDAATSQDHVRVPSFGGWRLKRILAMTTMVAVEVEGAARFRVLRRMQRGGVALALDRLPCAQEAFPDTGSAPGAAAALPFPSAPSGDHSVGPNA